MTEVLAQPSESTIGFDNVLRSEWTKLRSVRSTYWSALAAALLTVAVAVLICSRYVYLLHRGKDGGGFEPTELSLSGLDLAQIVVGALGVLAISSEYGTGMIRASLSAVPQRRSFLLAKATVVGVATLLAGELLSFTAYGLGQAILANAGAQSDLADPGVLRTVIGGGLYLTAIGLLGFGIGALVRHTAGALSMFFGVLFAPSALADLLPTGWRNEVIRYLPVNAGTQIITVQRGSNALPPWAGFGVLCLYAAAAIALAVLLITRRDA